MERMDSILFSFVSFLFIVVHLKNSKKKTRERTLKYYVNERLLTSYRYKG